jgi:hypothetical protein
LKPAQFIERQANRSIKASRLLVGRFGRRVPAWGMSLGFILLMATGVEAQNSNPASSPAQPQVKFTGLINLFGDKRALFVVQDAGGGEAQQTEHYSLSQGQERGGIKVQAIDLRAGSVQIRFAGKNRRLTLSGDGLEPHGGAATAEASAPAPPAIPVPTPQPVFEEAEPSAAPVSTLTIIGRASKTYPHQTSAVGWPHEGQGGPSGSTPPPQQLLLPSPTPPIAPAQVNAPSGQPQRPGHIVQPSPGRSPRAGGAGR